MSRVAVVTGAARGIGFATVHAFARAGWRTVGIDLQPPAAPLPSGCRFVRADVSDAGAVQQMFEALAAQEGRVDALVNNAAVQVCKPLVETSPEEWDTVMAVNLRAAYLTIRYAHPLLVQSAGAVVNVSSVHAVATSAGMAAYAASKGGLVALTRAVAIELAPQDVRVNAVLPGAVDTPMLRAGLQRAHLTATDEDAALQALAGRTVNGRVAQPAEIARVVVFLADVEQSTFMTGQALIVDGGATARLSSE